MRIIDRLGSLVAVGGIVAAGALGGCASNTDAEQSASGAQSSSSALILAKDISGNWELSAYNDGSQSLDRDGLAKAGYSYFLTINTDGTLALSRLMGTWEATGSDTYRVTLAETEAAQSGSGFAGNTVFDATYRDGKLHLVSADGANWIFTRVAATPTPTPTQAPAPAVTQQPAAPAEPDHSNDAPLEWSDAPEDPALYDEPLDWSDAPEE